jgi:mRNA interferase HigB
MHLISRKTLKDYWTLHPDVKSQLEAWSKEVECECWYRFEDILEKYRSADVLPGNRVVFNIKGNHYRLIVKIHYCSEVSKGTVYIRFIGTHAEYDRIDVEKI